MGQYYRPMILDSKKGTPVIFAYSHDFGCGLKLMEHSWMLNGFVGAFEKMLVNNPQPVVWGGDYADEEPNGENLYSMCEKANKISPSEDAKALPKKFKYLINHDKKVFVDKTKTPANDGWQIHPLPLLTCEGNLRGGGDYRSDNGANYVGSWSRDKIGVTTKKSDIPKDFKEIIPNFSE